MTDTLTDVSNTGYDETAAFPDLADEARESESPKPGKPDPKARAASRQKERDRTTRANIRDGARKALEIQGAGDEVRKVVSSIAGCEDDVVEIAVALVGPRNDAFEVIKDLEELSDEVAANPLQAGIRLGGMLPEHTRPLWKLLESIGADLPSRYPANQAKAAADLAGAIGALTDRDRELMASASRLAG